MSEAGAVRIDKWLWAARFFKTRSLAAAAVSGGDVRIGGERIKPARHLKRGEAIEVRRGEDTINVVVLALSEVRGPASVAQRLYEETSDSRARRSVRAEQRSAAREPALDIKGRPTKRDARALRKLRGDV